MTAKTEDSAKQAETVSLLHRWVSLLIVLVILLLWASWRINRAAKDLGTAVAATESTASQSSAVHGASHKAQAWYMCTMPECGDKGSADPNSRCPVCGMKRELVSMSGMVGTSSEASLEMSEHARRLAALASEPVQRRFLCRRLRTVGKVTFDETRRKMVSAWTSGRIDRLFADFTGMRVSQDDHLLEIYSPELVSAQDELLQARLTMNSSAAEGGSSTANRIERLLQAARRKLELLGVSSEQIDQLLQTETPMTHLVVHAPIGGTVVTKWAEEGAYVKTGDPLYEIADLTQMWILLDVYETDLPWILPFQTVRISAQSLPGESFEGRIAFIDPIVDDKSRTVKVRVHVPNTNEKLKPNLYVTALISASLGSDGKTAALSALPKFACPMHTWETSDAPSLCPVCGMDMVSTYTDSHGESAPAEILSVPAEAVMKTGERTIAYLDQGNGLYRGAELVVGPIAYDEAGRRYYPIVSGLAEGQLVVTRGNFVIDSQMQIAGKPNLFDAHGRTMTMEHAHHALPTAASVPPEPMEKNTTPHHAEHAAPGHDEIIQKTCPVMGGEIDPEVFIEYKGVRVYFCCWGCDKKFRDNPDQYIPKLPVEIQEQIRQSSAPDNHGGHAHD